MDSGIKQRRRIHFSESSNTQLRIAAFPSNVFPTSFCKEPSANKDTAIGESIKSPRTRFLPIL
jgi:hypothetical protein